jgi:hypothetical protein
MSGFYSLITYNIMAIGLKNFANIIPASTDYPDGRIKDHQDGSPGTPVDQTTNGDIQEFFAKLMRLAPIIPSGYPDNDYSGHQYVDALSDFINTIADVRSTNIKQNVGTGSNPNFQNSWFAIHGTVYFIRKDNHTCTVTGKVSGGTLTAGTWSTVFTLPSGYRPLQDIPGTDNLCLITGSATRPHGYSQILLTGEVQIMSDVSGAPTDFWINVTFDI